MKKNLVFKLGLFCAALVLVATCFVTNAWAKYTKSVTATDTARVAKFAFTVNEAGAGGWASDTNITVFDTTMVNILGDADDDKVGTVKLIAPGSKGSFTIEMSNQSEVTLQFELTATDTKTADIPVKWKFDTYATKYDSLQECLAAATTEYSKWVIKHGEAAKSVTIHWEWAYEGVDDDADTTLGQAGTDTYTVKVQCTATQVAPY